MNIKFIFTALVYLCPLLLSEQLAARPLHADLTILQSVEQAQTASKQAPVLRISDNNPLIAQIHNEFSSNFGMLILQLDQLSRPYSKIEQGCDQLKNKTLLFLSDEDGGYARHGFWLQTDNAPAVYCDRLYVDMTVSARDISNGKFLEVFAHEMAHVYLRRLKGELPPSPSVRFHNVLAVTDYQTAFDEGFGIYFQTLAAAFAKHDGLRARIEGRTTTTGAETWFSNMDGRERIFGVMHNKFVFEKLLPAKLTPAEAYQHESLAGSYSHQLKNAQAMLSSEGVIATLFYRLATAPELFALQPDNPNWLPAAVAMHDALFALLAKHPWDVQQPPYIQLLENMLQENNAYARAAIANFVITTFASSTDNNLHANFQHSITAGLAGDLKQFMQSYSVLSPAINSQVELIMQQPAVLRKNIGQPIWVLQPQVQISEAPWSQKTNHLIVNLNTATAAEIALLQLFTEPQIDNFIALRSKDGPYADVKDISHRLSLTASQQQALAEFARLFAQNPGYIRH